ncbi:MAG: bifunctional nuclease family protein [Actinomycetia bacterium]|nr:bifunctional nuclease family protein [Actinomycetes bacterium]
MKPVDVVGVRVEMPTNQPIVLLRERGSERYLPIWIGAVEATAIAYAQQGVEPARPLTHDLLADVVGGLGHRLVEVQITDLSDGVFFAELVFEGGQTISARPSDAIALALRVDAPVVASPEVLDEAGIALPGDDESELGAEIEDALGQAAERSVPSEGELERFREFLEGISPEDFGSPGASEPESPGPDSPGPSS